VAELLASASTSDPVIAIVLGIIAAIACLRKRKATDEEPDDGTDSKAHPG
jgi:hypothetical protein